MKITAKLLRSHNACENQVQKFKELFPSGCVVTRELCRKHASDFSWHWAAHNLLFGVGYATWRAALQRSDYARRAALKPISDQYYSARQPIDVAYRAALQQIDDTYNAALKQIDETRRAALQQIGDAYNAALEPIDGAYNDALAMAFWEASQQ